MEEDFQWADVTANEIIKRDKKSYVCSSGVSPSGIVHMGNFREIITSQLVMQALLDKGKKAKHIHYWDDYDRLRKVPSNVPKEFEKYIGMPLSEIPDPFKCHKSYALHFEKEIEKYFKKLGFKIEIVRHSEKYKKCVYAEEIKRVLNEKNKIVEILNRYRQEPLEKDWWPVNIYCEKCKKDNTKILSYDGEYEIAYSCECGYSNTIDFRKKGIVKPLWRIQWPIWWHHENVDFEPGGKEHYNTSGGSRITANEIFEGLYKKEHPVDLKYDFIIIKGAGGKMSSSLGNVITLKEVLEVYEPQIVKYLFASTRPNTEFAISFDMDVIKIYEDFDRTERVYFDKKEIQNEKKLSKEKRIYELSVVDKIPKKIPFQPSFRHLTTLLQIYEGNINKVLQKYRKKDVRIKERAKLAWNWLQKYAPDEMKFKVKDKIDIKLQDKEKEALIKIREILKKERLDDINLHNKFYEISEEFNINPRDFFKIAYLVLIGKEKGPKLASFILEIGKSRVIRLLDKL